MTSIVRRTTITTVVGALMCAGNIVAQAPVAPPPPQSQQDAMYHYRRSTVSVGRVIEVNGVKTWNTIGSAVFVTTDGHHVCLLTAKHVFYQPAIGYAPDKLWIRLPKDKPTSAQDFGVPIQLIQNGRALWRGAADGSDLAVSYVPAEVSRYEDLHAIGISEFGDANDVYQGASVFILGYPALLGESFLSTPIARNGIIAWTDPDDGLRKPFLVDANVFEGNSGGPVFHSRSGFTRYGGMSLGGGITLIGIVSQDAKEYAPIIGDGPDGPFKGTAPAPASGKPSPLYAEVRNIGGIGVIEPIAKARELVLQFLGVPDIPSAAPPNTKAQ